MFWIKLSTSWKKKSHLQDLTLLRCVYVIAKFITIYFCKGLRWPDQAHCSVPGCQVCASASRSKVFRNRSINTLTKYLGNATWIISCSANTVNISTGMLFINVSKQPLESREKQPGNDFVVQCFDVNLVDVAQNLPITFVCDQTSE